jgi:hypothetical protein
MGLEEAREPNPRQLTGCSFELQHGSFEHLTGAASDLHTAHYSFEHNTARSSTTNLITLFAAVICARTRH